MMGYLCIGMFLLLQKFAWSTVLLVDLPIVQKIIESFVAIPKISLESLWDVVLKAYITPTIP